MTDQTPQDPSKTPDPDGQPEEAQASQGGEEASAEGADGAESAAAEEALKAASEAMAAARGRQQEGAVELPDLEDGEINGPVGELDLLSDVNLHVKIELGRTRMLVEDVLRLGSGAVVELDKLAGDPVDVYVNDRHVARGEVLVLNDTFCVRISEIVPGATAASE